MSKGEGRNEGGRGKETKGDEEKRYFFESKKYQRTDF